MKAKFLSVLLALTMVLSLLPTTVLAADKPVNTEAELRRAIETASDGDTITIADTIKVDAPLVVKNTVTLTGGGSIVASDEFAPTSGYFTDCNLISLQTAGKTLTLENITLDAKGKTLVVYCNAGKVVVNGATITGGKTGSYVAGVYMTSASQFEMNSGSITGNEVGDSWKNDYTQYASDLWIGANANGALTSINGGKIGNIFVNSNEWSEKNPGSFTMNGGSVDNIYVEYDKGYGATFTYSNGTINHLYLSTTKGNGDCIEVAPVAGTTYKGGVLEDSVAQVGGSCYATVADAVTAAGDSDTVTLLANTTENVVIPADKDITLDLNGKTLTNAGGDTITNHGNLTVIGAGTVDNITHTKAALINDGTAVLNGGTFTRSKEAGENSDNSGGNSYYTILNDKGGDLTINAGVKVVNSGHFSSMIRNGGTTGTTSALLINGGSFSGGINTIKNDEGGTLTIKGGDFSNVTL